MSDKDILREKSDVRVGEGSYYAVFDCVEEGKACLGIAAEVHICQDGTAMCRIWPQTEEEEGIYDYKRFGSVYKLKSYLQFDRLVPTFELFPRKKEDHYKVDSSDILVSKGYRTEGYGLEGINTLEVERKLKIAQGYLTSMNCKAYQHEKEVYEFLLGKSKHIGFRRILEIACYLWIKMCNNVKRNVLLPTVRQLEETLSTDRLFSEEHLLELLTLEEIKNFMLNGGSKFKWEIENESEQEVLFNCTNCTYGITKIPWKKDKHLPILRYRKLFIINLINREELYVEDKLQEIASMVIAILDFSYSGQPQQGTLF